MNEYDLIAMGVSDRAERAKIARALRESSGGSTKAASADESDPDLDDSDVKLLLRLFIYLFFLNFTKRVLMCLMMVLL